MSFTKEDLKQAYYEGSSSQEMQEAGLEHFVSFEDYFNYRYKIENKFIFDNIEYEIRFKKDNANCIQFYLNGSLKYFTVCPPIQYGCDIINLNETEEFSRGYTFNFKGMVLITTPTERKLYHMGKLIAEAKRK